MFLQTSSLTYNKGLQVSESSVATLADGLSYLNTSNYGLVIGISQKIGNDEVYIGILPSYNSSIFNTYLDDNTRTQIKNEKFELALIELQWRQSIRKSDNLFLIAGFQYNIGKKDLIDSGLGKNIIFQIGAVLNFPL